jgi:enamine deaminase RidA (YjgF/YER057c/UK114 family)
MTENTKYNMKSNQSLRRNISSGSPFETDIGFSRAVRIGNVIAVSGTAPIAADGSTAFPGDVYGQTRRCFEIAVGSVEKAGGTIQDVIRTRVMLKDIRRWQEAARAHGDFFAQVRPACTFFEISGFINPDWLVEVEMDCVASAEP